MLELLFTSAPFVLCLALHYALLTGWWLPYEQALKANPERAPRELKVNANYIGRFGQVALTEALDMVYEMAGGREIVITY